MVRPKLLLVAMLVCLLGMQRVGESASAADGCRPLDANMGTCHVGGTIGNGGVDLNGNKTTPGGSTGTGDGHGGTGGDGSTSNGGKGDGTTTCTVGSCDPGFTATGGDVSLSDVKHLLGSSGIASMEPNGWAVIGISTNFLSSAEVSVVHTRLLDEDAAVRFTPIRWHWNYGDGTAANLSTGGATWATWGIEEFDPTPTSHIFRQRGDFTITLGVEFSAEYRFADGGWILIDGTLTLPSNPLRVTAGDATTVLVGRDCNQTPRGPGC